MTCVLRLKGLGIHFGGLKAVSAVDLNIEEGIIFGLIGPNGAGKTTVFNLLTGVYQPTEGSIELFNEKTAGVKTCKITARGLSRTFQNIRLFKGMTVLENVLVSLDQSYRVDQSSSWSVVLGLTSSRRKEEDKKK